MEKKYVAYYRLSKQGKRTKGLGLHAQEHIVRHYYGANIVKEFTEIKSRKNMSERPIIKEAIQFCLDNGYYLVTAKVDRLSGNVDDARYILATLKGRLYCCDIPGEVDKFSLTMYTAFAERERELISLRTSQSLQAKMRIEGKHWANENTYDISKQSKAGTKEIKAKAMNNENNKRAASVICSKLSEGYTYKQIVEHLNANAFKTAKGKAFNKIQVQRIQARYC